MSPRRRSPAVRFVRPSWNAKKSACARCGAIKEQPERLLVRLNICTQCIEEARHAHH